MYELVQIAEHTYYVESPAKVGVVEVSPGEVVLIDSGGDRSAAKKVRNHLNARGWRLRAISHTRMRITRAGVITCKARLVVRCTHQEPNGPFPRGRGWSPHISMVVIRLLSSVTSSWLPSHVRHSP